MRLDRALLVLVVLCVALPVGCGDPPETETEPMDPEITEEHPVPYDLSDRAPEDRAPAPPAPTTVWSYSGESGPDNWAALDESFSKCGDGVAQSPVDLVVPENEDGDGAEAPKVTFDHKPFSVSLALIDHLVRLPVLNGAGGGIHIDGTRYELTEIHFHTPGEHRVAGAGYPIETHLVHRNDEGDFAVLGIFGTEGEENEKLEPLFANLPEGSEPRTIDLEVSAADFLPAGREAFQYGGSLTTPPCSENVRWFVLAEPVDLSADQIERLDGRAPKTNRPIRPLGDRTVVRAGLS